MIATTPISVGKWAGLAYLAAVTLVTLAIAPFDLFLFFAIPWIVGPAGLAALCAKISRAPSGSWFFLALELAIIAVTVLAWIYLLMIEPDPQNGIAMLIFLPLYQYGAVAACFGVALLLGWRARAEFLAS